MFLATCTANIYSSVSFDVISTNCYKYIAALICRIFQVTMCYPIERKSYNSVSFLTFQHTDYIKINASETYIITIKVC